MPQQGSSGTADAFVHPQAGRCKRDRTLLAIHWRPDSSREARDELLDGLGLTHATASTESRRPGAMVNRTDLLSWVRPAEGRTIGARVEKQLERSDLVEWVGRAFRREGAEADEAGLFTVNPSRLFVTRTALDAAEIAGALGEGVALDTERATKIPGLIALRIDNPSASEGRAAIEVGTRIAEEGTGTVRFENIPYLSPACHGGDAACAPPTSELLPNDPEFPMQWGMRRINAPRAWEVARGDPGVVVAVIDEGVELGHPDLYLHPQSWNASTDTPDGSPTGNHGTACAGIVAARLDNGLGVAGVAGGSRVMAIATATWADIDVAEGLYFAADNGARVVSMSFGVYPSWGFWDFDLVRDALQYAHDHGLLLVAASGNEDIDQARFPGSDSRTLCVGGSNRDEERKRTGDASGESWWGACYGDALDVVAPCLEIPTTDRLGGAGYGPGDFIDGFNGTSSATPHVAGLGALLLSLRPSLTNVEARSLIESTCDKISPDLYAYANVGSKPSGTWHREVGYGRINAERALLAACALGGGQEERCAGCGGECLEDVPHECQSPEPIPWLAYDRCMSFYEARLFGAENRRERMQIRVTYEHCLRLLGRQQGPLIYTLTLLPDEEVTVYEYDRYRRVRQDTERISVQSSFRQTLSALSQARTAESASAYRESLEEIRSRTDTSVSVGGGLAGFLGAPSAEGKGTTEGEARLVTGAAVRVASERFTQVAVMAAQSVEAERSILISRFEDEEHREATSRRFRNDNHCHAVTYMVRRINEAYEAESRVAAVEWREDDESTWRNVDDPNEREGFRKKLEGRFGRLPRAGEKVRDPHSITLPTDGTLYEPELAHCSSCEPSRGAEELIDLELKRIESRKRCIETELLELELERRRSLAAAGTAEPLDLSPWVLESPEVADGRGEGAAGQRPAAPES